MSMDAVLTYRQAQGQSAHPLRLVVLLYEQLVRDVQHALLALEQGQVEERCQAVDHALEVAAELQVRLDMEGGGEVARHLQRFYEIFRTSLLQAQIQCSKVIFQQQITNLLSLREAWLEVERAATATLQTVSSGQPSAPTGPAGNSDWTG